MENGVEVLVEVLVGVLPSDFKKVVKDRADRNGQTVWDALVGLAIMGAEHSRRCEKNDHKRTGG